MKRLVFGCAAWFRHWHLPRTRLMAKLIFMHGECEWRTALRRLSWHSRARHSATGAPKLAGPARRCDYRRSDEFRAWRHGNATNDAVLRAKP